jgi:hypothetical protein
MPKMAATAATAAATASASAIWCRRAAVLIVVVVGGERLLALVRAPPTDFDDAYMFLRYANNVLAGFGLRWNRDEPPVYGATSLPHVLVVALVRGLRPRWSDAAVLQAASRGAAVLFVVALVLTCARFARHPLLRRQRWLWGALLVPLITYAEPFGFQAQTGMDTLLAALANTGLGFAALWLAEAPSSRRALATAAMAYGAYLVRPDNAVYAGLVPALCLLLAGPQRPLPDQRPGQRSAQFHRPLVVFVAALALLVALDLVVKQRLLGTPWPLGAIVKRPGYYGGFAGEFTWNPFLFLRVFLGGLWPFLIALVLFTGRASARVVGALLIPVTVALPLFFGVNQIMGHLGRFYFPAAPFVVIAAALSFDRFVSGVHAGLRGWPWPAARVAGAVLMLWGGGGLLTIAGARYEARAIHQPLAPLDGFTVAAARPLPELDSWRSAQEIATLARAAPAGTRFAMSEHGLPGAAAPDVAIIDVLGLHDRDFARRGFQAAALWRRHPDLIWMPHPDHTQMIRDILDSDSFWSDFEFYPDAFSYGVALRRGGPRYLVLADLLRRRWQANYPGFALQDYLARRSPPATNR